MSEFCGLVPTLPSWRMKLQARKTTWSAVGYGPSLRMASWRGLSSPMSQCRPRAAAEKAALPSSVATIFTASALCIGATGLRPFSNLPRPTEMPPSLASVSPKQEPVGTEAQNVQEGLGRSGHPHSRRYCPHPRQAQVGQGLASLRSRAQMFPPGPHPPLRRPLQNQRMAAT